MGPRVLIIKVGALGDVVRTGAIIPGLRQLTGEEPHVTWLTSKDGVELVQRMPGVDRVLAYGEESLARLRVEKFDVAICLDKEPGPCAVEMTVQAGRRLGIGLSRYGTPFPLNEEAEYYFRLGLDNDEKFHRNQLTYQQLVYEALGMTYHGERYDLGLTEADRMAAERRFASFEVQKPLRWIGINPGAGGVFAYKAWREGGYIEVARQLAARRQDVGILLLGGPQEAELLEKMHKTIKTLNSGEGIPIYTGGTTNRLGAFAAIIDRCDVVVCGDTLAMHLAIARRKRVVALFGPTCEQEIDLFGRGVKIKSPIECSPCYRRSCDKNPTCQDQISEQLVLDAIESELDKSEREFAIGSERSASLGGE